MKRILDVFVQMVMWVMVTIVVMLGQRVSLKAVNIAMKKRFVEMENVNANLALLVMDLIVPVRNLCFIIIK